MRARYSFFALILILTAFAAASLVACGGDDDDDDDDTEADDDADSDPDVSLSDCVAAFSRLYGPDGCLTAMYDEATIEGICSDRQGPADSSECVMALYADNIDCLNAVECDAETADADYAACEEAFQSAAGAC